MRTPEEAIALILERVTPVRSWDRVPLEQALGRVLAQDVLSDLDLPPFEKSAMDGFAVHSSDFQGAASVRAFALAGESRAGTPFRGRVGPGECVAISTGAELPADCDAVVMVERSRRATEGIFLDDRPVAGQHVCHRGEDLARGASVLHTGRRLRADDLSVLAAVGCQPAPCFARVRVALVTTGDELVPANEKPAAGQIREGNTLYLAAALASAGAAVTNLGIVRDDEHALEARFRAALEEHDALVTTGGVSMGAHDLVGRTLERIGVEPVLHKIAIKPGKPLWFGQQGGKPVFGLPGNPVSCLVGFHAFVRRALSRMSGAEALEWERERLPLGRWRGAALAANPRQQNHPVRARQASDGLVELEPLAWRSSADIVGVTRADGFAVVAAGTSAEEGTILPWRPL
ncbi:MAG: molybdopterin molybdotransferase MoeA [Planctomycetes bacterium]|nr:molybdopterin molybdotransferase MoeA [Planctomycetota bacterium]